MRKESETLYLESAKLKNYKSLIDVQIDFLPGLNILIGKNGSGKTNLLTLLSKIISLEFGELSELNSVIKLYGREKLEITFDKSPHIIKAGSEENVLNSRIEFNTNFKMLSGRKVLSKGIVEQHKNLGEFITDKISALYIRHGYPDVYPFVGQSVSFELKYSDYVKYLYDYAINRNIPLFSRCLYADFYSALVQGKPESDDEKISDRINDYLKHSRNYLLGSLSNIMNAYSPISEVRVDSKCTTTVFVDSIKVESFKLEFKLEDKWHDFNDLSDGTKRIVYMIMEMSIDQIFGMHYVFNDRYFGAIARSKKKPVSRVVFLEEPELGVHPKQFHNIMKFVESFSKDNQVIMSTHAPQALDYINIKDLDRIIVASYDQERGSVFKRISDRQKEKAKSYVKDAYLRDMWIHSTLEI